MEQRGPLPPDDAPFLRGGDKFEIFTYMEE